MSTVQRQLVRRMCRVRPLRAGHKVGAAMAARLAAESFVAYVSTGWARGNQQGRRAPPAKGGAAGGRGRHHSCLGYSRSCRAQRGTRRAERQCSATSAPCPQLLACQRNGWLCPRQAAQASPGATTGPTLGRQPGTPTRVGGSGTHVVAGAVQQVHARPRRRGAALRDEVVLVDMHVSGAAAAAARGQGAVEVNHPDGHLLRAGRQAGGGACRGA